MGNASDVADDELPWRKGREQGREGENGEHAKRTTEATPSHQPFSDRISLKASALTSLTSLKRDILPRFADKGK